MKHNIFVVLAFAFLSACASALAPTPVAIITAPLATQADIPKAHIALKRSLKDPESARFGGDVLKPGAVCGLINSKNSLGGYGIAGSLGVLDDAEFSSAATLRVT